MEETVLAIFFFWAPGAVFVMGALMFLFAKESSVKRAGQILVGVGILTILLAPWTIPFSPSSSFGHFIGSIVGPTALLAVGIYNLSFSGNVPVGRLSMSERRSGIVMIMLGVLWFEGMHWWILTPTYPAEVNGYWFIFWSTTLLVSTGLAAGAIMLTRRVGDNRIQEQRLLTVVLLMLVSLVIMGFAFDGPRVDAERFAHEFWLAGADVFGMLVGFSLAIFVFAFVIAFYESQLPEPSRLPAPTEDELTRAAGIIATHTEGGTSDE